MYPLVTGLSDEPSTFVTRSLLTVTARLHESGQSSGHTVSTMWAGTNADGNFIVGQCTAVDCRGNVRVTSADHRRRVWRALRSARAQPRGEVATQPRA